MVGTLLTDEQIRALSERFIMAFENGAYDPCPVCNWCVGAGPNRFQRIRWRGRLYHFACWERERERGSA
jgi:hypothetical protein